MKVLFVMRHSGYVRNFESTLRLLCERGHRVHLAFQARTRHHLLDSIDIAGRLASQYATFSHGMMPIREDGWGALGSEARLGLDYLRYLTPVYRDAPKLRRRVERDVAAPVLRVARGGRLARAALSWALRQANRAVPTDPAIDGFIAAEHPDLLIVTPLVEPASPQAEYVRSARSLGVPTVLCVASWDNLTNKGLVHEPVDLVTVWNEEMKREAITLHGIPAERVVVTGAQPFDHWFDWRPRAGREAFCERVALDPDRPFFLYVCSSKFVAPDEAAFVRRWLSELRRAESAALKGAGVLIRPHPQHAEQWRGVDLSSFANVVIYPPGGAAPIDDASRSDYYDSIYHSAAIVGINTTAEIESAIVGRPVLTVLAPEFRETQDGTLHFQHLREVNGGLLHVAASFPEHLQQLEGVVGSGTRDDGRCRRFVEAFVRPFGVDAPATPRLVDALERVASRGRKRRATAPGLARAVRPLLRPLAQRLHDDLVAERERRAARDAARQARLDAKARRAASKRRKDLPRQRPPSPPIGDLVATFAQLNHRDRATFVRQAADALPPDEWFELQRGRVEPLDFPEASILMHVASKAQRMRLHACAKEPWTVEWLRQSVGSGDVLYDIGANVGAYSLIAAMKPNAASRIIAIEASYDNIAALCANIALNGVSTQITPLAVALAGVTGLDVFNLLAMAPGAARHSLGGNGGREGPTAYAQPVLTYRLDDLIAHLGLPAPTHLKLDVDGGEVAVLEGATRTLASPVLRSMLVEVGSDVTDDVTRVLETHGFGLHSRVRVKNTDGEFRVWYGVFARPGGALDARLQPGDHMVVR